MKASDSAERSEKTSSGSRNAATIARLDFIVDTLRQGSSFPASLRAHHGRKAWRFGTPTDVLQSGPISQAIARFSEGEPR